MSAPACATSRPADETSTSGRTWWSTRPACGPTTPDAGGRPRPVPRARVEGRAHRRPARPDQLRDRADPAHREVGAVRHPVATPLDRRHHRHRLDPRHGAPGGDPADIDYILEHVNSRARDPADARRHPGRLRRSAAAAGRRERVDLEALPRARGRPAAARARRDRRRQVHDLPGDGAPTRSTPRRTTCRAGPAVDHRQRPADRCRRLPRDGQPGRPAGRRAHGLPRTACGTCSTATAR